MATHGYIRVENEGGNSVLHAFHDGYTDNMLRDILELPSFIYNFLKTNERNSYKHEMITKNKEKKVKDGFDRIISLWSSLIPIGSIDIKFTSWMIAFDPLMYIHTNEVINGQNIYIKFSNGRLASCVVTIDGVDENSYNEYIGYIDKTNKSIYLDKNKIKKIPSNKDVISFQMNINLIVLDYIWQELDPSINRDKRLDEILKTN